MDIHKFARPPAGQIAQSLVAAKAGGAELQVGSAFLPRGTRVPAQGVNAYPNHEVSFVMEGCLEGEVEGKPCRFTKGDVIHMLPGETQWGIASEDTVIYYIFFGDAAEA